jgi:hypothetical protein
MILINKLEIFEWIVKISKEIWSIVTALMNPVAEKDSVVNAFIIIDEWGNYRPAFSQMMWKKLMTVPYVNSFPLISNILRGEYVS